MSQPGSRVVSKPQESVRLRHAHQQPSALAVEVERGAEVDRERGAWVQALDRLGHHDLPAQRLDRQVHPGPGADLLGPRSGCDYDAVGRDAAPSRVHRQDLAAGGLHASGGQAGQDGHPCSSRGTRVAQHHRLGRAVAVSGSEQRSNKPLGVDEGREPSRLLDRDHPALDAHRTLQLGLTLERGEVGLVVEEEEVADLVQVDLLPEVAPEAFEGLEAVLAEPDVDLVGEARPHTTGGSAGRACAERSTLEQHDAFDAGSRQVVGGAQPHDAAADDDDVGGGRYGVVSRCHGALHGRVVAAGTEAADCAR